MAALCCAQAMAHTPLDENEQLGALYGITISAGHLIEPPTVVSEEEGGRTTAVGVGVDVDVITGVGSVVVGTSSGFSGSSSPPPSIALPMQPLARAGEAHSASVQPPTSSMSRRT